METFIQRHQQDVIGVLRGFDRMRFRGTLRSISYNECSRMPPLWGGCIRRC